MQHHLTAPQHPGTIFYFNEQLITLSMQKTEQIQYFQIRDYQFLYIFRGLLAEGQEKSYVEYHNLKNNENRFTCQ